jgi:hypothetical protein
MFEPTQFLDVRADFQHGVGDVVRILFRTEEDVVGKPNGLFVGGTFGDGTVEAVFKSRGVSRPQLSAGQSARFQREQRALVNWFVKEAVAGNPFHLERAQE